MVDELQEQQQIVIKTLGDALKGIPGISGGAIMPKGQVGLILDVGGLVKLACHQTGDATPDLQIAPEAPDKTAEPSMAST